MARSSRHKQPDAPRRNWPVAGLAALGLVVAGYLAVTKLGGESPLFCTAGGGCDIVQASRYAVFLGLPTALWGAGLYAAIGGLALTGLDPRRWLAAFLLAVAGVSFSAYLTYLQLFEIRAFCGYCVLSAVIAVAIFGVLLVQRPAGSGRRFPARTSRVVVLGMITAVATVLFGAGYFASSLPATATAQEALARHLADSGAMMYGAYWCPACSEQKARFGPAAYLIPYVECDPRMPGSDPGLCARLEIKLYPTWFIKGVRYEGVLSIDRLATLLDFKS